ncbi:spexin prohormone 2 isoform X1 [Scophthalmus maximus]|uniref:spexin prohormone 2 isoform X1 n=2 Tax=Scophthalmus maximus TaxID=52904 RepID=UPI0015E084BA|nr:spexin prohormone 2 isoform X1 [Scophthalmus maximus]
MMSLTGKRRRRAEDVSDATARRSDRGVVTSMDRHCGMSRPFLQYHQAACHLSRDQTANMQPQAPPAKAAGGLCESKSRKSCRCNRSRCLKLYCECFANGLMCSSCNCFDCHNNTEHEATRHKAIQSCLGRKPDAFRPKIAGGKSVQDKGWHNKGCNCKRSSCLKNYCECFEANIMCSSRCKCVDCRNYDSGLKEKTVKEKGPVSVITPTVVKEVCSRLLAKAVEAEREDQSPAQTEDMVLEEFSDCLNEIVMTMFNTH